MRVREWPTYTRRKQRRMARTIDAYGERSPAPTATVVSSGLSSRPICHHSQWAVKSGFSCIPATFEVQVFHLHDSVAVEALQALDLSFTKIAKLFFFSFKILDYVCLKTFNFIFFLGFCLCFNLNSIGLCYLKYSSLVLIMICR